MKDDNSSAAAGAELTRAYWKELDPSYIERQWAQMESQRPIMMSAAVGIYIISTCSCGPFFIRYRMTVLLLLPIEAQRSHDVSHPYVDSCSFFII